MSGPAVTLYIHNPLFYLREPSRVPFLPLSMSPSGSGAKWDWRYFRCQAELALLPSEYSPINIVQYILRRTRHPETAL